MIRLLPHLLDPKRKKALPKVPVDFMCEPVGEFVGWVHGVSHSQPAMSEVPHEKTFKEMFSEMSMEDVWADALMPSVVRYLKGSKYLDIPTGWCHLVPSEI